MSDINYVGSKDLIAINRVLRALTQLNQACNIDLGAYVADPELDVPIKFYDCNGECVGGLAWNVDVKEYVFQTTGIEK
mgnify:CR=1 FL=1